MSALSAENLPPIPRPDGPPMPSPPDIPQPVDTPPTDIPPRDIPETPPQARYQRLKAAGFAAAVMFEEPRHPLPDEIPDDDRTGGEPNPSGQPGKPPRTPAPPSPERQKS